MTKPQQRDLLGYVAPPPSARTTPSRPRCQSPGCGRLADAALAGVDHCRRCIVRAKRGRPRAGTLLAFDANNLAHRSWHGQGGPPHHRFGVAVQRVARIVAPTHIVAVWDGRGPTWRHAA